MAEPLDMSLDDIIKNNRKSGSGNSSFRGRGGAPGPGPSRRFRSRGLNRAAPYSTPKAPEAAWSHHMFVDHGAAYPSQPPRASAIQTGTKLYVSNLDYGVSNEDIKELFSEVGDLKRYSINYDKSGRSKGTAEVVFSKQSDAIAAIKRYNNVQLDGKPMKLEIVGTNIVTPVVPAASNAIASFGNSTGFPRGGRALGVGRSRGGGRGRGPGRGGRGRGRGRGEKLSAEDLDADLEKYHEEAMQIN
ncbi:THO complex subunit 4A-like [Momordica charantia]|uniref:THO complex subunit 4A-like n=1 Tax=Momordica charantia TaxID=3673 RepID=A0A6J1DPW3_MOMCH|nr:THO complex subunit 4A-like [Momordica charantia]XP_022156167.1 THO complex subunit 4A-like [Momordica charantia]XP_022156168.1 THO complex subunit 4A-like [Momordica charantia]